MEIVGSGSASLTCTGTAPVLVDDESPQNFCACGNPERISDTIWKDPGSGIRCGERRGRVIERKEPSGV